MGAGGRQRQGPAKRKPSRALRRGLSFTRRPGLIQEADDRAAAFDGTVADNHRDDRPANQHWPRGRPACRANCAHRRPAHDIIHHDFNDHDGAEHNDYNDIVYNHIVYHDHDGPCDNDNVYHCPNDNHIVYHDGAEHDDYDDAVPHPDGQQLVPGGGLRSSGQLHTRQYPGVRLQQ